MKGIILAGGSGTRLYPVTKAISKQIVPVYDKPMIYYPLSVLMMAGIRDILIISTPRDIGTFRELFGDGADLGLHMEYAVQPEPKGLAQAFLIGADFIGDDSVSLILGDNIFYGQSFGRILAEAAARHDRLGGNEPGATIFGYYVKNPEAYGVVAFDEAGKVTSIEEKPKQPKSRYAVPGLYFYDNRVVAIARELRPSARGELEITDLNRVYLQDGQLNVKLLGRGMAWLDTGTHDSMLEAGNFVEAIQKRQRLYVACIEEIAYKKGFIDKAQLIALAQPLLKTEYGQYLLQVAEGF